MKSIGTQIIETERLILRRMTIDDAQDMFDNWASDDDITMYMTWQTHQSLETSKEYISFVLNNYNNPDYYEWIIEYKESGKAVGSIGCINVNKNMESVEAGYCLSKKYWNKGIMSEALKSVIEYLFKEAEVNRIESFHLPPNTASGKVMQKCGMKFEGIKRQGVKDNKGRFSDAAVYSIIKDDYFCKNEI